MRSNAVAFEAFPAPLAIKINVGDEVNGPMAD
jgi:hypothetical protein